MLTEGPAKRVTVSIGEDLHRHGEPLYLALLNYLFYHAVSGATVSKGVAGFGPDHHLHTTRILEITENLPITITFVETAEKLDAILPKLLQMVGQGVVDVQDTTILRAAAPNAPAPDLPRSALHGKATLMRIYIGADDRWHGKPLHEAIVESLRANDIAGVTVYRGIAGYGAHGRFRKERRLSLSTDAPIMLSVVDEDARIRAYLPTLEQMVQEGLVALSDVDVIKYTHRVAPAEDAKKDTP